MATMRPSHSQAGPVIPGSDAVESGATDPVSALDGQGRGEEQVGLVCRTLEETHPNLRKLPGVPLLSIRHGSQAALERDHATGALRATLPMRALGSREASDLWTLHSPIGRPVRAGVRALECGPVQALRAGPILAGAALFDADPLEHRVTTTYRALLNLLAEQDVHLLRVWNAVPSINQRVPQNGQSLDRYMVFCRARSMALEESLGRDFPTHLCSASAVGASGHRGIVLFLAAQRAGERISNPRQEEAWRYPPQYGPRAPSFARATRLPAELGGFLLVSGTASIKGAESLHGGDPDRQLDETLANLAALLRSAQSGDAQCPLKDLRQVRVFIKKAEHLERLRQRLLPQLAPGTPVHWVQADICRPELLIEIEGVAR